MVVNGYPVTYFNSKSHLRLADGWAQRVDALHLGPDRAVVITRTTRGKALIVRGTGYDVDRARPRCQ